MCTLQHGTTEDILTNLFQFEAKKEIRSTSISPIWELSLHEVIKVLYTTNVLHKYILA
jgi:hypothetical protein